MKARRHPDRRRSPAGERGASLVELALLLPLAIGLALGIFTGGAAYFRKITVVDAAREGGRFGASLPVDPDATGMAVWEDRVKNRVAEVSGGELAPTDVCVKLVYPTGGTDCGVSDPVGASAERTVQIVKVSATKPVAVEFLFFTSRPTLSGRFAARYERDTG